MTETQTARHTPGPWIWHRHMVWNELDELSGPDGEEIICPVLKMEPDSSVIYLRVGGHNAADRDLIAAAPDLLEACEAITDDLDSDYISQHSHKADVNRRNRLEQLRAAIAKATG